ncbi:Fanconi anemia group J protein homolog [Papaver somniferum]|uniref:Fanconi anemia group J protein homolog n=1 Tax=Papaver somniferum TaxID=3469 RepID=UPI000E6FF4AF|nr:Fanconi anemia group J protein homolog [Papaver somniferum]
MEESPATPKPNPNSRTIHHIGGLKVEFPYKPYGSQLAFMGRVISTLDRGKKQGHCHALLESPTGTGKSLSLLCSALAWQQNYKSKNLYSNLYHSRPEDPSEVYSDPLVSGGGFIHEPQPSSNLESGSSARPPKKKKAAPTIYYATRTHSQISQVVREYRKTSYRVPMAILASRKNYCTNETVCGKEKVDEECKLLLKEDRTTGGGCFEFKNAHKVKCHPSLQKGGCNEAHDIEDLVKVGRLVKGCSYFAARSMAEEAQLVFCPYNYIINSAIRRAMEVDLKDSIVILDEAHNIEDMARDAGSVDVEEDVLCTLQTELGQLCFSDSMIYQPLYETIQGFISWMAHRKSTLVKHEFQHHFSCWTGDNALRELREVGISQQHFPILQECATKAIKAASDAELGSAYLTGLSMITLEGLFSSLGYFFAGGGLNALDYQLVLRRYVKRGAGQKSGEWTYTLSLWCLNPAVVFREIADLSMTVILTSGTLSPMDSFSSELGVQFETCMEAPHVIDVGSQLWSAVVSTGPGNYPLNASYKTADAYTFQDELGASLEEICKIVPGGALVFFPSYSLMDKLCKRWGETGQWSRLNAQKSLFVEPRGNQDDFESVLKGYKNSISQGKKPGPSKIKRGKKRDLHHFYTQETSNGGAALLAVCRGKVSEGIDFSDDNARVVVIVGIPFPNTYDIQVAQKKKYNDTYSSSRNLLSGSRWYCHQAFRALNQAAGRCIRHRFDYGAIIFMDERYKEERNTAYVSKWLRKSIKHYDNFGHSLEGLQSFFKDVKEWSRQKYIDSTETSDINVEDKSSTKISVRSKLAIKKGYEEDIRSNTLSKGAGKQKITEKVVSKNLVATEKGRHLPKSLTQVKNNDATHHKLNHQGNSMVETIKFARADETKTATCREYIDLECGSQKHSRFDGKSVASSTSSPESPAVKGNSGVADTDSNFMSSPADIIYREGHLSSTVVEATNDLWDQQSAHSRSLENSNGAISQGTFAMEITPERGINNDPVNLKSDTETSLSMSVNSHSQKRRKPVGSLFPNSQTDQFRTPDDKPNSSMRSIGASNLRIKLGFDADCTGCDCEKLNVPERVVLNNSNASSLSSNTATDKILYICCSLCKSSLGLPENDYLVTCSLTSSSKVYLTSALRNGLDSLSINEPESVPVVISDVSSVDRRLYNRLPSDDAPMQGTWSAKDGCVFSTIFCPFCTAPKSLLGLHVMATDAPNMRLLNKIMFYFNSLEIKNLEVPKKNEPCLPAGGSNHGRSIDSELCQVAPASGSGHVSDVALIDKFAYVKQEQDSGGWRTTRSKLKLPNRRFRSMT